MFSWFKTKKRKIRMVCFDLDNTLIDYSSAEAITEAHIMGLIAKDIADMTKVPHKRRLQKRDEKDRISAFKISSIFNEIKHENMSRKYDDFSPQRYSRARWFTEMFRRLGDAVDEPAAKKLSSKADAYEQKYWKGIMDNMKPFQNTNEVLETLSSGGIKLALITDSDGKAGIKKERLERSGLSHLFDYIILTDDTGSIKPADVNWKTVLMKSGFEPEECMMVGDHPEIDLITAKKLGFITVWTKQAIGTSLKERYVDHEIHDIKEILDIVKGYNG